MEDVFRDPALSVGDVPGMLLRGGLTWYGGLLGGLLVLGLLSRAVGVKVLTVFNAIAPGPFPTWMLSTGVGGGGDVVGWAWAIGTYQVPAGTRSVRVHRS